MHDEEASEEIEPKTQGVQPTAPLIASYSLYFPAGHEEQLVAPPIEYSPAGQATMLVRSDVGLKPAGADLQEEAIVASLYWPFWLHCSQVLPSSEYVGGAHCSHEEEPSEDIDPMSQAVQPTAPLSASYSLYFPARHEEQLVLPPIEYVPAGQATIPVRSVSEMGLKPAGAVEHVACPFSAENSPSSEH